MHRSKHGSLFDHLIGEREQLIRYGKAEHFGRLPLPDSMRCNKVGAVSRLRVRHSAHRATPSLPSDRAYRSLR